MGSSDDDSGVTVKSGSWELSFFRSRLVSILEAPVLFYKGLQVCESALGSTHKTVTCSTPPLSCEPTHWLRCRSLSLSVSHKLTHTPSPSLQYLASTLLDNRYSHKSICHGCSKTLRWVLHLTPVWLWPPCLRTLLFFFFFFSFKLASLITHTPAHTHTLQIERFNWIDLRQLTAARLLTYSISHSCTATIPRGICLYSTPKRLSPTHTRVWGNKRSSKNGVASHSAHLHILLGQSFPTQEAGRTQSIQAIDKIYFKMLRYRKLQVQNGNIS